MTLAMAFILQYRLSKHSCKLTKSSCNSGNEYNLLNFFLMQISSKNAIITKIHVTETYLKQSDESTRLHFVAIIHNKTAI